MTARSSSVSVLAAAESLGAVLDSVSPRIRASPRFLVNAFEEVYDGEKKRIHGLPLRPMKWPRGFLHPRGHRAQKYQFGDDAPSRAAVRPAVYSPRLRLPSRASTRRARAANPIDSGSRR